MSDFNITLFEACELLNRSKKSISRYIRRGLLHPQQIKSQQGTLEYRFSESELKDFKEKENESRQDRQDTQEVKEITDTIKKKEKILDKGQIEETGHPAPEQTGQDGEVITLLKETTGLLRDQLKVKDEQIKDLGGKIDQLIERDRETNILLKGLQEKVLMLEQPKDAINADIVDQTITDTDEKGQDEPIKPLKEKKTRQTKPKAEAKTPEKKGFWQRIFK